MHPRDTPPIEGTLEALRARFVPASERRIVAAMLDAAAPGGRVDLPEGTIMTPLVIERGMTVSGSATGWTLLAGERGSAAIEVRGTSDEVVLERLIVRGGGGRVGAIAIAIDPQDPSMPKVTLRDCVVFDGASTGTPEWGGAGGITIDAGRLTLERCVFAGNRGTGGGAVAVRSIADLEARACAFIANEAERGAAVYAEGDVTATLVECTLTDNRAAAGSVHGRFMRGRTPRVTLVDCLIRAEGACFGHVTPGYEVPIVVRRCTLPEAARRYARLDADQATTFGGRST